MDNTEHISDSGRSSSAWKLPRKTILVVDDEPDFRDLVASILREAGYRVEEASDGSGVMLPGHNQIDLLITDIVMPKMSGHELAKRLAALRPGMKVLYLSGYTVDAIVHHGMLESDTPFLQKPFSPDALGRKVREVLDG